MGMGATVPVRQNPKRTKSLENSLSIFSFLFVFAWLFQFAATEMYPLWGLGPPLPPTVTRGLDGVFVNPVSMFAAALMSTCLHELTILL